MRLDLPLCGLRSLVGQPSAVVCFGLVVIAHLAMHPTTLRFDDCMRCTLFSFALSLSRNLLLMHVCACAHRGISAFPSRRFCDNLLQPIESQSSTPHTHQSAQHRNNGNSNRACTSNHQARRKGTSRTHAHAREQRSLALTSTRTDRIASSEHQTHAREQSRPQISFNKNKVAQATSKEHKRGKVSE